MGWVAVSRLREIPEVTENPDKATRSARKTPLRLWGWWGGVKGQGSHPSSLLESRATDKASVPDHLFQNV